MFPRLLIIETRKTAKHPALWLGLSALTALLAFLILIDHAQIANGYQQDAGLAQDVLSGLSYFSWIGLLVYAVAASVIAASDYQDRSIQLWLMRGTARSTFFLARLTTILLFGLLLVIYAVVALVGLAALSRLLFWGGVDAAYMNWSALPLVALRLFWSATPYLGLALFLSVLSRSPWVAAAGVILYGAVAEPFLVRADQYFPALVRYFPAKLAQVLYEFNRTLDLSTVPSDPSMSALRAGLVIGLLLALCGSGAFVVFSRQELGGS